MTKRITALLIAVIIPIMTIFTGCSSKPLTPKEYYDELYTAFKEYVAELKEVTTLQTNVKTIEDVQTQLSKAKDICTNAEKALDKFSRLNPPEQFADKHKKLLTAVDTEKKLIKAMGKVFTAKSLSDLAQFTKDVQAVTSGVPTDQQFAAVFKDLILEVKAAQ